jgi:tetratricopeptide (TPR) repeat protein
MQNSGCLLVSRNDLFGARMLPFVNALRIGHDYDIPVKIYWPFPREGSTNIGEHEDVFSKEFIETHFITHQEFKDLSQNAVSLAQVRVSPAHEIIDMVRKGSVFVLHGSQTAMTLKGEDPRQVSKSYRATLDRMTFTPIVTQNIDKINAITKGQNMLAYHVRHGDVTTRYRPKNKPWPNKFIPSEFFIQHFEKHGHHDNSKALLFGDFDPSLEWLCGQCPDLIRISDVIDLKELGSLQRDFLELYAMSRAETIVGPRSSGFSQLAASMGGVDFRDIMKDMGTKDYTAAYAKLSQRIRTDPESFSSFGEIAQCLAHLVPYQFKTGQIEEAKTILSLEIERGNQIAYLFPFLANACFQLDDYDAVLAARKLSMGVPMFDALSIADTDALASMASTKLGDTPEAMRLLNLAAFQTPYSSQLKSAFAVLDELGAVNDETFYPIDRALMAVLYPGLSPFQSVVFAWEWRHSMISNFQRPLTHAGAADRLLATLTTTFNKTPRSAELAVSFDSFKSVVLLGHGRIDEALELSVSAVDAAPDNPHVLRRHVQNLIHMRMPEAALPFAQKLCEIAPNVRIYQTLLAVVHLKLKQRKKAMHAIAQSQTGGVTYPAIILQQAYSLLMMKQPEEAELILDRVLPEVRWPDRFLDIQTTAKIKLGRQNEILPMLLAIQKEAGAERTISYLIAKVRQANGDLEGAAKDAEFAMKYGANLGKYKVLLATIYRELGRQEEAETIIEQLPPMMKKRFLKQ